MEYRINDGDLPVVYMTTEISAESLMAVYEALAHRHRAGLRLSRPRERRGVITCVLIFRVSFSSTAKS